MLIGYRASAPRNIREPYGEIYWDDPVYFSCEICMSHIHIVAHDIFAPVREVSELDSVVVFDNWEQMGPDVQIKHHPHKRDKTMISHLLPF